MPDTATATDFTRHLSLEGGVNVRDLGGYEAADGRTVKWRRMLRSGHLSHLSREAWGELDGLNLRTIHDFRRAPEKENYPTPANGAAILDSYDLSTGSMGQFMDALEAGNLQPDQAHAFVVNAYGEAATQTVGAYRDFFGAVLAQDEGALLFHCMAG